MAATWYVMRRAGTRAISRGCKARGAVAAMARLLPRQSDEGKSPTQMCSTNVLLTTLSAAQSQEWQGCGKRTEAEGTFSLRTGKQEGVDVRLPASGLRRGRGIVGAGSSHMRPGNNGCRMHRMIAGYVSCCSVEE